MRRTIKPPNSVIEITSVDRVRRIGYSLVCLVWCWEFGDTFGRLFGIRLGGHFRPGPRLKVCSQLVFNVSLGLQFSWYRGRKDSLWKSKQIEDNATIYMRRRNHTYVARSSSEMSQRKRTVSSTTVGRATWNSAKLKLHEHPSWLSCRTKGHHLITLAIATFLDLSKGSHLLFFNCRAHLPRRSTWIQALITVQSE